MQRIYGEFATHHMNQVLPERTRAAASSPSAYLQFAVSYSSLNPYLSYISACASFACLQHAAADWCLITSGVLQGRSVVRKTGHSAL